MSPIPNYEEGFLNSTDLNATENNAFSGSSLSNAAENRISDDNPYFLADGKTTETLEGKSIDVELTEDCSEVYENEQQVANNSVHRVNSVNAINVGSSGEPESNLPRDTSNDALSDARVTSSMTQIANIDPELCGMPLCIFTKVGERRAFDRFEKELYKIRVAPFYRNKLSIVIGSRRYIMEKYFINAWFGFKGMSNLLLQDYSSMR
jgi:hypothetical protein